MTRIDGTEGILSRQETGLERGMERGIQDTLQQAAADRTSNISRHNNRAVE